ncbi:MAG: substrate-binding domain-containing protein, partial [Planctomycetota bacterium]|nr:substrate-binding domain-containing protein [Planctomycetota bacterium]
MTGKRMALIGLLVCLIAIALYYGASRWVGAPAPPQGARSTRTHLMLLCGAGIRPAAEAIIAAYHEGYGTRIDPTYAGGGRLLGQIASAKKGDLFMPGAEFYVDKAIEKGWAVPQTKRIVAYFVPVIFVRKGNPKGVYSLRDLSQEGLRVGFGDERACAVGEKTLDILEKNGIPLSEVQPNVIYKSGTVNELAVAIQMGSVDAVILWDANARQFARYGQIVSIPLGKNIPVWIPIVRLACS